MAKHFYVYGLVDPSTPEQPFFYIGKGSGDRKVQHFRSVPKALQGEASSAKFKRIEDIKAAGLQPGVVIMSHHTNDDDAYAAEQAAIAKLGLTNLTNQNGGGAGDRTRKQKFSAKMEHFCQLMVTGTNGSASDCYRIAYPGGKASKKSVNEMASALMSNPKIISRIEELRAPIVKKVRYDLDWCLKRQNDAANLAEETGNAGALTGAVREIGKLIDVYPVEKSKVELTSDDLVLRIQQGRARASGGL